MPSVTNCDWQKEMLAASDVAVLGTDAARTVGDMLPSGGVLIESLFGAHRAIKKSSAAFAQRSPRRSWAENENFAKESSPSFFGTFIWAVYDSEGEKAGVES